MVGAEFKSFLAGYCGPVSCCPEGKALLLSASYIYLISSCLHGSSCNSVTLFQVLHLQDSKDNTVAVDRTFFYHKKTLSAQLSKLSITLLFVSWEVRKHCWVSRGSHLLRLCIHNRNWDWSPKWQFRLPQRNTLTLRAVQHSVAAAGPLKLCPSVSLYHVTCVLLLRSYYTQRDNTSEESKLNCSVLIWECLCYLCDPTLMYLKTDKCMSASALHTACVRWVWAKEAVLNNSLLRLYLTLMQESPALSN